MTIDVHSKVGRAIDAKFADNWTVTDIQYVNTYLEGTDALDAYIELQVLPVDASQPILGLVSKKGELRDYELVVSIYTRRDEGPGTMEEIADDLEDLLNRDDILLLEPDTGTRAYISFEVPIPPEIQDTEKKGWLKWLMVFPFHVNT